MRLREIKNEFPSSEATKSISHELKTLLIETVRSLSKENENMR